MAGRLYVRDNLLGDDFTWEVNPNGQEEVQRGRNISYSSPTGYVGLIRQQGDRQPFVIRYKGRALTDNHWRQMNYFHAISEQRTLFFRDIDDDEYQVTIPEFRWTRVPVAFNPRDPTYAPYWVWDYVIGFDVFAVMPGSRNYGMPL